MGKYYQKFLEKNIDLAPLGIQRREDNSPYFCTPRGARILGWAGVDGIHYCLIRGFGETVFAVSPMEAAPPYVRPLARSFEDFLRLLLACGDANILEQAWQWSPEEFSRTVQAGTPDRPASRVLDEIRETMHLTPMEAPWAYIQELQSTFDYSKIRYTEEFYDPDMNEHAPLPQWAVYYDGTIYGHTGHDRAGTEIPVRKEFCYAGRTWLLPAVYACAKGLVADFCMRVDAQDCLRFIDRWNAEFAGRDGEDLNGRERLLLERKNPLCFGFDPQMIVNGKVLRRKKSSGICFIPGDPSEPETRWIAEHYQLDLSYAWNFTRACFPWKSARRPEIKSLELIMTQEPAEVPGDVFEAAVPGQQIDLNIPGHPLTLTVKALEAQTLDTSMMSGDDLEYPACYSMLTYTLAPTPEPDTFSVRDLDECDQPRQIQSAVSGNCEAAAIAIIGGADGPTAIIIGAPQTEQALAACSSPHFEPAAHIRWYPVLRVTEYAPLQISLL